MTDFLHIFGLARVTKHEGGVRLDGQRDMHYDRNGNGAKHLLSRA